MKIKLRRLLLALLIVFLLFVQFSDGAVFAQPTSESGLHPVVPYHELADDVKQILYEYASPPALQSIRAGRSLRADLVQAGIGREKFEGNIVAVYHEYGVVYIFRGSGQIISADAGRHGVEAPEGAIVVLEEWCTEKLESKMGRRQPPEATQPAPSPEGGMEP